MKAFHLAVVLPLLAFPHGLLAQTPTPEKVWEGAPWSVYLHRNTDGRFEMCRTVIRYDDGTVLSMAIDKDAHLIVRISPTDRKFGQMGSPVTGYLRIDKMEQIAKPGVVDKQGDGSQIAQFDFEYNYNLYRNLRRGRTLALGGDLGEHSLSLTGSAKALRRTADCVPRPYGAGNAFEVTLKTLDGRTLTASRPVAPSDAHLYGADGRSHFDCAYDALTGKNNENSGC